MADSYICRTGLDYTVDPLVDACVMELREQLSAAHAQALATNDPRDLDAAKTAQLALNEAIKDGRKSGAIKRAEMGHKVSDIPEKSIPWLLQQGLIFRVPVVKSAVPEKG